ncbi:hypothetical protein F4805DRAFT_418213 [Annulohypoxylon moriforme]|nr:hypothetical protein F4805DRAFT_418213 [Annulohypoxylon moriforme]
MVHHTHHRGTRVDQNRSQHHYRRSHQHGQDYYRPRGLDSFQMSSLDSDECRFPRWPFRLGKTRIRSISTISSWFCLAVAFASQIIILIYYIKFVNTDNTGFEPDHPKFQLFKNSRFEECWSLVPDATNCTVIMNILHDGNLPIENKYIRRGYIIIGLDSYYHDGATYDWCTVVSCFNEFKVIPSSYRPSTIGLTGFELWNTLNIISIIFIGTFARRHWILHTRKQVKCTGTLSELGVLGWSTLIYSLSGPIAWWWVSFIRFAADPVPNTALSVNAWCTTWLLASNIHYHPYSCILRTRRRLKGILSWLLIILAVAQWIATIYVFSVGWVYTIGNEVVPQGYDCLESMLPDAPGATHCSAEKLCLDGILLSNLPFSWKYSQGFFAISTLTIFSLLSLAAAQPFIFASWLSIKRAAGRSSSEYSWSEQFMRYDIGPISAPASVCVIVLACCGIFCSLVISLLSVMDRDAPVVVDMNCTVVHVGLSTWRYYLDLSDDVGARSLRIAKAWFNA